MVKLFMNVDVKQLTISELEALRDACQYEITNRNLPELSDAERAVAMTRPIEAIKIYKNRVGCGLRDAKDVVDRARRGI